MYRVIAPLYKWENRGIEVKVTCPGTTGRNRQAWSHPEVVQLQHLLHSTDLCPAVSHILRPFHIYTIFFHHIVGEESCFKCIFILFDARPGWCKTISHVILTLYTVCLLSLTLPYARALFLAPEAYIVTKRIKISALSGSRASDLDSSKNVRGRSWVDDSGVIYMTFYFFCIHASLHYILNWGDDLGAILTVLEISINLSFVTWELITDQVVEISEVVTWCLLMHLDALKLFWKFSTYLKIIFSTHFLSMFFLLTFTFFCFLPQNHLKASCLYSTTLTATAPSYFFFSL